MAKLYFYYSAMNAGKSTALLQASYNYQERGMQTMVITPSVDDRYKASNEKHLMKKGEGVDTLGETLHETLHALLLS